MIARWMADAVGEMHLLGITGKRLAEKIGWNLKYLSQVLNGHETPKGAKEKVQAALTEIRNEATQCHNSSNQSIQ